MMDMQAYPIQFFFEKDFFPQLVMYLDQNQLLALKREADRFGIDPDQADIS